MTTDKITASCMVMLHELLASLTESKAAGAVDTSQSHPEKEAKQEEGEAKPAHSGYGAKKKFPYIDE